MNGTGNWTTTTASSCPTAWQNGVLIPLQSSGPFANVGTAGVAHGEWWRLLTASFLHYGLLHIGLNMFSLYFAGSILEQVIGHWRFLLLYLVSGIAGSAGALLWSPNALTVGASGATGVPGSLSCRATQAPRDGRAVLGLIAEPDHHVRVLDLHSSAPPRGRSPILVMIGSCAHRSPQAPWSQRRRGPRSRSRTAV